MKKYFLDVVMIIKRKKLPVAQMLMLGFCLFSPYAVEAKSIQVNPYTTAAAADFRYFWNFGGTSSASGWAVGLSKNLAITITYNVEIRNTDTQALINTGDSIPVGTKLSLKFLKHEYTDVHWVGTGYSSDSPDGEWRAGAAPSPVACLQKDFVNNVKFAITAPAFYDPAQGGTPWFFDADVYIPLVVSPPTKTIVTNLGTGGISCSALTGDEVSGYIANCTVSGIGTIKPQFNFGATTGAFYYRYNQWYKGPYPTNYTRPSSSFCIGNNTPLIVYNGISYALSVPAQAVSYDLVATPAVPANKPPNAPTVSDLSDTPPSYSFNINATDPDGDQVKYGIDWNHDEKVDEWLPASGLVDSATDKETSLDSSKSITFQVRTEDEYGLLSLWTQHKIILPFTVSCTVKSYNDVTYNTIYTGHSADLIAGTTNGITPFTYLWTNDGKSLGTQQIQSVPFVSSGIYSINIKATDSNNLEANGGCIANVANCNMDHRAGCSGTTLWSCDADNHTWFETLNGCVPSNIIGDCDPLDGITVASGTARTFYSSRISKSCDGRQAKCKNGVLIDVLSPTYLFSTSTYKYRTCVTPVPSEF